MKASVLGIVAMSLALTLTARAQSDLVISSFHDNGVISWTNPAPNSVCRVEWAPSVTGLWSQNWNANNPIPTSTNVTLRATVPLFYRVVCNLPPASYPINYARLQFPASITVAPDQGFDVYARLYIAGLTDQSDGVDTSPSVLAEIGYGPDGSEPVTNIQWNWTAAVPTPGWSGNGAGEPNNDEYTANIAVPGEGVYDFAARFSGDTGATWTYADLNGTPDGYQTDQAGALTVAIPPP